jgi:thiosulfate dehydrogenase [quinone] large subunit
MGMSFFGHGLLRLPKLQEFAGGMATRFKDSPLPESLVQPFGLGLPILELTIGALLLAGLFTRYALYAAATLMIILIFGSCMVENWAGVGTQLLYSLYVTILIALYEYNRYSLDYRVGKG